MSNCPFCKQEVNPDLLQRGGYCPHCEELILVTIAEEGFNYAPTEAISPEDIPTEDQETEELERTDPLSGASVKRNTVLQNANSKAFSNSSGHGSFDDSDNDDFGMDLEEVKQFHRDVSGKRPLTPEMKKLIMIVFFCLVGVGVLIFTEPSNQEDSSDVNVDMYVPEVTDHKGNEIERVEEEPVEQKVVQRYKKKTVKEKKKPKVVEVGGMEILQTNRPPPKTMLSAEIGAMSSDERIDHDINRLRKNLQYCHTRVLKKDPNVRGKWQVSFTIKSTGDVHKVRVKPLREKNSEIEDCMFLRINKFGFSKPTKAYPVKFSILFG
jgi:hypothetical protein